MEKKGVEQFFQLLAESPEHHARARSFGGDMDALSTYVQEMGYDVSSEELKEYQDKAWEMVKAKAQKKLEKTQAPANLSQGVRDFYALLKLGESDTSVGERLAELAADAPEALAAYGKEKGFIFDEKDIQAAGENILEPSDELSDDELEMAAGGTTVLLFVGILAFGAFALGTAGVAVAVAFAVSKKKG